MCNNSGATGGSVLHLLTGIDVKVGSSVEEVVCGGDVMSGGKVLNANENYQVKIPKFVFSRGVDCRTYLDTCI